MRQLKKFLLISSSALFFQAAGTATGESSSLTDSLYDRYQIEAAGFMEARGGIRLQDDADEKDASMGEARLRLEMVRDFNQVLFTFKGDLLADGVTEEVVGEIRDLSLLMSPLDNMDIKLGREVLTWGTGDLIFINDMFPKDWQSFFVGRDDEYLKAPSNAVKVSMFFDVVDVDLVYTPLFGGSEFINGERLSYYSPMAGGVVGRDMTIDPEEPNRYFRDGEISGRLSKNVDGIELALYGYSGFWQEPEGVDSETGRAYYPRLNVWGGSVRTSLLGGIGNLEAGYYDSINNSDAKDPFIRPSEYRFLAAFERELARELTGGFQYYLEVIDKYDNYKETVATGGKPRDEYRHLLTLRLTKLLMNQNLKLSLFVYYSPSDNDHYARPKFSYKLTDHWLIDGGFNLFRGNDDHTFWGQFQDNTNVYAGLRYSF